MTDLTAVTSLESVFGAENLVFRQRMFDLVTLDIFM